MKAGAEKKQKVFINQEGVALITCPVCSKQKSVRIDPSAIRKKEIRESCQVRCACQERFTVKFEFRRYSRKKSDLSGEYLFMPKGKPRGKLTVVNVSQNGICVQITEDHQFNIGDELLIWFTLDDNIDSLIEKRVKVRYIKQDYIGCEFIGLSPPGKALRGFLASIASERDEGTA